MIIPLLRTGWAEPAPDPLQNREHNRTMKHGRGSDIRAELGEIGSEM